MSEYIHSPQAGSFHSAGGAFFRARFAGICFHFRARRIIEKIRKEFKFKLFKYIFTLIFELRGNRVYMRIMQYLCVCEIEVGRALFASLNKT